jgi:hypothetical protein
MQLFTIILICRRLKWWCHYFKKNSPLYGWLQIVSPLHTKQFQFPMPLPLYLYLHNTHTRFYYFVRSLWTSHTVASVAELLLEKKKLVMSTKKKFGVYKIIFGTKQKRAQWEYSLSFDIRSTCLPCTLHVTFLCAFENTVPTIVIIYIENLKLEMHTTHKLINAVKIQTVLH